MLPYFASAPLLFLLAYTRGIHAQDDDSTNATSANAAPVVDLGYSLYSPTSVNVRTSLARPIFPGQNGWPTAEILDRTQDSTTTSRTSGMQPRRWATFDGAIRSHRPETGGGSMTGRWDTLAYSQHHFGSQRGTRFWVTWRLTFRLVFLASNKARTACFWM